VPPAQLELAYAIVIVVVLMALAVFFGIRQIRVLRSLPRLPSLAPADRAYQKGQAWRRLANSVLMAILAVLLAGTYWLGQERRAAELGRQRDAARASGAEAAPATDELQFVRQYSAFWAFVALLLLVMVGLAFYDLWAIRRFARKQLRQIQADRREMIEQHVAELRGKAPTNGWHPPGHAASSSRENR
jgi:hypothetical protein